MKDKIVAKIIGCVKNYNPKLTVIKITRYKWIYLIIAVYDIKNGFREMDPFYIYHPLSNRISGYCPTSNLRRFGKIQAHGKLFYQNDDVMKEFSK